MDVCRRDDAQTADSEDSSWLGFAYIELLFYYIIRRHRAPFRLTELRDCRANIGQITKTNGRSALTTGARLGCEFMRARWNSDADGCWLLLMSFQWLRRPDNICELKFDKHVCVFALPKFEIGRQKCVTKESVFSSPN